jgi:16S rRNA (guanine527-N7)-methyltransferase
VDVGSGAGLPGIPLAIADPTRPWRLLEPRARRAAFLEEVVRTLDLDCEVSRMSAEEAARTEGWEATHSIATARALAPPWRSFELLRPLLSDEGTAVVFAGGSASVPPETRVFDGTILYGGRNA